jgi:hypothetical protein
MAMKVFMISLAVGLVFLTGTSRPLSSNESQNDEVKKKASVWMKAKLELSRNILAGLTEADYNKVTENAKALNFSSYLEALFRADRPHYNQQVTIFIAANQELIRQAKEKNLYGATLAYNQMTVSCIQCHQIVRGAPK